MTMTRKHFLQTVAGATAFAAMSAPGAVSAAAPKANIKRGVSLYSYTGDFQVTMTLEDCLSEIADLGAEGIEILCETHIPDYPNPSNSWVDHWFSLLDKYKIKPACYSSWVETKLRKNGEITVKEAVDWLLRDMRLANRLGFKIMRPKLGQKGRELDPIWREMTERALPYAEKYDVRIAPEIHAPTLLKSKMVEDFVDVITKNKTEYFGILVDTGVFATRPNRLADQDFESEPDPKRGRPPEREVVSSSPKDLLPLMPYILSFHSKFWEMQDDYTEYCIPFETIIPVLIEGGYKGYLCSEYEGPRDIYLASKQLRRQHVLLKRLLGEA
jgi:hypothetical protein